MRVTLCRMRYDEAMRAFDAMLGNEVRAWIWERQPDGLTYIGTDTPAEGRLTAEADGYVVDGLRFNIEPQKIANAEWRDDPEPHTLWLVQGERSILLTPARP
jgi:hypothetical protein